jgi:uncharacterized membrane protein YqhA
LEIATVDLDKLFQRLVRFRFVSVIAVVASGFGSLLMFIIGAVKVFRAYLAFVSQSLLNGPDIESILTGPGIATGANIAIVYLVQAIDAFLIAIGLMIFGGGIYNLFVCSVPNAQRRVFGIQSIAHLKSLLAELIVVILIVKFLEDALHSEGSYQWNLMLLPAGVLLIAIAVRILQFKDSQH